MRGAIYRVTNAADRTNGIAPTSLPSTRRKCSFNGMNQSTQMNYSRALVLLFVIAGVQSISGCRGEATKPVNKPVAEQSAKVSKSTVSVGKAARLRHADQSFDTYKVNYPTEKIELFWKDDEGRKMKSIDTLKAQLEKKGRRLSFATNAGMYTEDHSPLGLYVEKGKVLKRMNRVEKAFGNFYLQPNGVFLLTSKKAMVVTRGGYQGIREKVLFATQSGPMLVIDGKLHPAFTKGSKNLAIRSGVGIDSSGETVFAISNEPCSFYDFATLFQQQLHCRQALFLDGTISRMYLPVLQRTEWGGDFGVMIATSTR